MAIAFFDAAGTASAAGIFIPRNNITGLLTDAELASSEPLNTKLSKFIVGFLTTSRDVLVANRANALALDTGLGLDVTKGAPSGTATGRFSQSFTASFSILINNSVNTIDVIPVPTFGSSNGKGVLLVTDAFPGAVAVASGAAVASAGVLIPNVDVDIYGAGSSTSVSDDMQSRKWFGANFRMFFDIAPLRASAVLSAITSKTFNALANATLPTNATAVTNPTTGINPADLNLIDTYTRSVLITVEYSLNETTQTYDVYIA